MRMRYAPQCVADAYTPLIITALQHQKRTKVLFLSD